MSRRPVTLNAIERWELTTLLCRLAVASTRLTDHPPPINVILVGPPGHGKTELLRRLGHIGCVRELSDATYLGLTTFLTSVKAGQRSALIIPDFGTLLGRRYEVARQAIALLAMMAAEGVGQVAIGKRIADYRGTRAAVIGAITYEDLGNDIRTMNQNAFLSRCFLIEHEFAPEEAKHMRRMLESGRSPILKPAPFPAKQRERTIKLTAEGRRQAEAWWDRMLDHRPDRSYGFRSAVAFETLLRAAAWLRGGTSTTAEDVRTVAPLEHLWLTQYRINPDQR